MDKKNDIFTFLSFTLGKEELAVDVKYVVKILELRSITQVPQSPEYLKGIINIEGKVIPVFNAYYKFGFKEPEDQTGSVIIILNIPIENDQWEVGIVVEKANEVFEVSSGEIQDYPALGDEDYKNLITGVIKRNDQFILILDAAKMFEKEEINKLNV